MVDLSLMYTVFTDLIDAFRVFLLFIYLLIYLFIFSLIFFNFISVFIVRVIEIFRYLSADKFKGKR